MITYLATNTKNGKFYIGSTTNFEWRKYCHLNQKRNYPFQNALRKNPDAFVWEVFYDDSDEPVLEQALLDKFFGTEQCYNLNPLASRPPSQAGRPVSDETRRKQSAARKGKKKSDETKLKLKKSAKRGEQHPFFGVKGSAHPSSRRVGELNHSSKKVEVTHPDGTVEVFPCTKLAAKKLGVSPPSVALAAQRNRTKTKGKLKGFSFRYLTP
jgi:group I intron endonuclease